LYVKNQLIVCINFSLLKFSLKSKYNFSSNGRKELARLADRFWDAKLSVALTSISADSKADIL
jgi:hypothetical protein